MHVLVSFFRKQKLTDRTKDAAKDRLLVALTCDREEKKSAFVKSLKTELAAMLEGYDEVDGEAVEFNIRLENNAPSLNINIPIRRKI